MSDFLCILVFIWLLAMPMILVWILGKRSTRQKLDMACDWSRANLEDLPPLLGGRVVHLIERHSQKSLHDLDLRSDTRLGAVLDASGLHFVTVGLWKQFKYAPPEGASLPDWTVRELVQNIRDGASK